jgi:transglutaminase-like putative cysteine protease
LPISRVAAVTAAPNEPKALDSQSSDSGAWKTVELTNQIDVTQSAQGQIWLPVPVAQTSYQELVGTEWSGNFAKAGITKDESYGAQIFFAQWDKPAKASLKVTYKVRLRDRTQPEAAKTGDAELYLKPTKHISTNGIVKETANKITGSEKDADKKAKLIYNWIAENTFRDPKVRGCGLGDISGMLASGNLGGKCADLSSLFVGLCRASGVPAREVFGLRVLPSMVSKSLGKEGLVSGSQHCRAEYLSNRGWVPVDPADVRKAILEDKLDPLAPEVAEIRKKLFGAWEMNWVAFNSARDFTLPPNGLEPVNYLMYPLLVAGDIKKDGMDPNDFNYTIQSKKLV